MKYSLSTVALTLALLIIFSYVSVRLIYFILYSTAWYDRLLSALLLSAELFGLVHSIGYFFNVIKVTRGQSQNPGLSPISSEDLFKTFYPSVAVLLPSYKEPLEILEDTLICFYNLSYPNKQLYLLDDSRYDRPWDTPENVQAYKTKVESLCEKIGVNLFRRKWKGAKAGIINDFIKFLDGEVPEELEFHHFQNSPIVNSAYIAVFDADMNPLPDFLMKLVAAAERDPKIAFVQTPQYYTNFDTNRVAWGAGLQQLIFFEYICEGKGRSDAMFCCGSNVLIQKAALSSVGGFDEGSVTEDFATSLKLHIKGWKTVYYNEVMAFGLGPEDLGAYFKQQFRWALGTLALGCELPGYFLRNLNKVSLSTWWEYFLSASHYLTGWFFFIMVLFPIIYIFFDMPTYFMDLQVYLLIFIPYITIVLTTFVWTLYLRGITPLQTMNSILIGAITFPIYMKASIYALLRIKGSFTVTPKSGCAILPLRDIWPQLALLMLCLAAFTWGAERLYYEREPFAGILANMIWCLYNGAVISSIFYFNAVDEIEAC